MKIGLIPLISSVHNKEFVDETLKPFLNKLEENSNHTFIETEINNIDEYDLNILFVKTGGSEREFLKFYEKLPRPIYILSTFKNNSFPASLEILSYIRQQGEYAEVIAGETDQIIKKIDRIAKVNQLVNKLKNTRLGIIGQPSDWLISSDVDYKAIRDIFGIDLIDIPIEELQAEIEKVNVNKEIARDFSDKAKSINIDYEDLLKSTKVFEALNMLIDKYKLNDLTLRCFDLVAKYKTTGCLALSHLNDLGITSGCEADIPSIITMIIAKALSSKVPFMANPSYINTELNELVFAHCTVGTSITEDYKIKSHFETGLSVGIQGMLKEGKITVLKMGGNRLDKIFSSTGILKANYEEDHHCRTQILVKMDTDVNYFLTRPLGNHHIISTADISEELELFANRFNLKKE